MNDSIHELIDRLTLKQLIAIRKYIDKLIRFKSIREEA
jgi:hypothetical protein